MSVQGHDELGCILDTAVEFTFRLEDAMENDGPADLFKGQDELREALPALLAQLTPNARTALADQVDHVRELVAFTYRMSAAHKH